MATNRESPISSRDPVQPGQFWMSRDPRDEGLKAVVISSDGPGGFVYIKRYNRSRVRYERFLKAYQRV